jgi:hypothetical protein
MGEWVNANTRPDAVFLVPRAYTAELTWDRTVTWITFYGNTWVVDAITTPDERQAHDILSRHGIDYVVVPDPPGTYIDRMPATGMRSYLMLGREDLRYFTLVHMTEDEDGLTWRGGVATNGLRLYRVNATAVTR